MAVKRINLIGATFWKTMESVQYEKKHQHKTTSATFRIYNNFEL